MDDSIGWYLVHQLTLATQETTAGAPSADPAGSIGWQIVLQFALIALNAVFACAEIAVITMNDARLAKLAAEGNKSAIRLARLTSQPAKFLATIQVAITLAGFLGSAFAAENFSEILVDLILKTGINIPAATLNTISVVIITLILSYFTLVFGELVPKRVAMRKAEKIALKLSGIITFISKLFAPIVWLLTASTNGMLRLFGIDPNQEDEEVTEENIRMMVDVGSEKGVIDVDEKEIIQNVFEFDDLTVGEVATHRTQTVLLWDDESDDMWQDTIYKNNHSFFPVCGENGDKILGVLSSRTYLRLEDRSRESVMKNAVTPAWFVPDSMNADSLFRAMKSKKQHFAVVLDEYGGMHGVVTINDLLEAIVGEFDEDEFSQAIKKTAENVYRVNCGTDVERLTKELCYDIDTESTTISGWVLEQLDRMPTVGDTFTYENLDIKVTKTDAQRVLEIEIVVNPSASGDGDE